MILFIILMGLVSPPNQHPKKNTKKNDALGEKKPEVSKLKKKTSDKKPEVENKLKK